MPALLWSKQKGWWGGRGGAKGLWPLRPAIEREGGERGGERETERERERDIERERENEREGQRKRDRGRCRYRDRDSVRDRDRDRDRVNTICVWIILQRVRICEI